MSQTETTKAVAADNLHYRQNRPARRGSKPSKDRCAKDHRTPSHISKAVPPTVHSGPPN